MNRLLIVSLFCEGSVSFLLNEQSHRLRAPIAGRPQSSILSRRSRAYAKRLEALSAEDEAEEEDEQRNAFVDTLVGIGQVALMALPFFLPLGLGALDGPPVVPMEAEARAVSAAGFKPPPINRDIPLTERCRFVSSAMGQANAARDKLLDLRECDMSGKNAKGFDLSGALGADADFRKVNFENAQLSKGYFLRAKFDDAKFFNSVTDRADFTGASLRNVDFRQAVLTGTNFEDANVEGADFSDIYIGDFGLKQLCKNPTLKGTNPVTGADSRESAGCNMFDIDR
uniref:Pentapeptide repeat protein n=1 Tax=Chromera velia CCMP2878 TaxID=1169474 RepID=A0A0G4GKQ7_9ALVE|mmetsp:Transcript_19568/g.39397  ORF Transcript_19568/g.39397 Transcript_19568/m.39397 type:complete len:284 (-) Transcript_19568:792-1643(-)|eukprot:Cvel_4835.t1-p1 / transcript=Cvel_4835.t1 / gene=Cvel_4835 / organism=Chromera_velia_CCMP2878 / gene_product=Thylakoid lumenal 17.4 kDa protein, chloroplastic, putative / transcript_product=Thylakoid lumenal 17.4 kDa protein, chloroplastic, putative / location=Cvel_scaffold218:8813-12088(-) / protein_length=283 / sequence_SO=supercontig / SO=protein_coding / is_pseudo=false